MRTIGLYFLLLTFLTATVNAQLDVPHLNKYWTNADNSYPIHQFPKPTLETYKSLYAVTIPANPVAGQLNGWMYPINYKTPLQNSNEISSLYLDVKELNSHIHLYSSSGMIDHFRTEMISQKTLKVLPRLPRLLREGDGMEITSQIANWGDRELTGIVVMELVDAYTEKPVDGWFQNVFPQQYFTVAAGKTETIRFPLQIPFGFNKALKIRIKAKAGNYEDGEENILPVLTNRVLITESTTFWNTKDTSLSLQLPALIRRNSPSISDESFQFEIATQPAWYVLKSLPHLIQNTSPCTEQIWHRLLANQLASYTFSQYPAIAHTLDQWKKDTSSIQSIFKKNQSLQAILTEENPWVQQAQSEAEQLNVLSTLLDSLQLKNENTRLLNGLKDAQLSSGGFRWMEGEREDLTTTLYILNGITQLTQLGAWQPDVKQFIDQVSDKALQFTDSTFAQFYHNWQLKKNAMREALIPQEWIAYAWMRNQFPKLFNSNVAELDRLALQLTKNWQRYDLLAQTWIAQLAMNSGNRAIAINQIIPSLFKNAMRESRLGLYWNFFPRTNGYYSKMTLQSRMFTLFKLLEIREQQKYQSYLPAMIQWELQQKKSNHWINTPCTADACFSILNILPKSYFNTPTSIEIKTGELTYQITQEKSKAGTGYFRQRIDGKKVSSELGKIKISTASEKQSDTIHNLSSPVTGSFYWQYFEDIQKVKDFQHPSLDLQKTFFRKKSTGNTVSLEPITALTPLKINDQVIIRLTITCMQAMDYVFVKDMLSAGMEPVEKVSKYKSQVGLGYYQISRDAHTSFFIRHIEKGKYEIEYTLNITHMGSFSGGIAQIGCLYNPQYRAHSANTPIRVAE